MAVVAFPYNVLLFISCGLLTGAYAVATPYPVTATSALTAPDKGIYFSIKGFRLGTEGTSWLPQEDNSLNKGEDGTSWRFSNAKNKSAQVHVKTDFLKAELTLEAYAKRWMKDYSHLGMDVLGTRPFAGENARGFVIDIIQAKKKLQLRQAVFVQKKAVVVLTCSDEQDQFSQSLDDCNRLIKNFSWSSVQSNTLKTH